MAQRKYATGEWGVVMQENKKIPPECLEQAMASLTDLKWDKQCLITRPVLLGQRRHICRLDGEASRRSVCRPEQCDEEHFQHQRCQRMD